jgi:hypothetical protein
MAPLLLVLRLLVMGAGLGVIAGTSSGSIEPGAPLRAGPRVRSDNGRPVSRRTAGSV